LSTAQTQSDSEVAQSRPNLRPEISKIIESGRMADVSSGSVLPVVLVAAISCFLMWVSFSPMEFAPAAWVAIVPLCLLLRIEQLPRFAYRALGVCGFVGAVCTLQWMRLGHWTMYGALAALSFYISLYFPAFVFIGRRVVKAGCPLWLTVPVVWTALEFLRAYLFTGFSWYYLGHSQYLWTSLVQISDVTGAYGVSFLVALSSGVIADCLPANMLVRLGLAKSESEVLSAAKLSMIVAASTSVGLVLLSVVYGSIRMQPLDVAGEGPVVAVAQGNFTPELKHDPDEWLRMVREHDILTRRAAGLRPDLIVWPETMFPVPDLIIGDGVTDADLVDHVTLPGATSNSDFAQQEIDRWHSGYARELLENRSQEAGAAMLVGLITEVALKGDHQKFNSAAFIRPDLGYSGRYDKLHRVLFGEYIPLRTVFPWLAKVTPFGEGFGIDAGIQPASFEYANVRFAPIICFEDTVPQLVRRAANTIDAAGKTPDVLINMTNDGWFRGSSELDQHLITATFRCIENRKPMVRAVNAGISAFIDSSGRIRQPEQFFIMNEASAGVVADFTRVESMYDETTGRRHRQCSAVMCGQLPLDGRSTIYAQFGDWFAILCGLATVIGLVVGRTKKLAAGGESANEMLS